MVGDGGEASFSTEAKLLMLPLLRLLLGVPLSFSKRAVRLLAGLVDIGGFVRKLDVDQ